MFLLHVTEEAVQMVAKKCDMQAVVLLLTDQFGDERVSERE